jgi:hypothetical protein
MDRVGSSSHETYTTFNLQIPDEVHGGYFVHYLAFRGCCGDGASNVGSKSNLKSRNSGIVIVVVTQFAELERSTVQGTQKRTDSRFQSKVASDDRERYSYPPPDR